MIVIIIMFMVNLVLGENFFLVDFFKYDVDIIISIYFIIIMGIKFWMFKSKVIIKFDEVYIILML